MNREHPLGRRGRAADRTRWTLLGTLVLSISGCPGPTAVDGGPDDPILFLVQRSPATSVMQALYRGRVHVDQEGCLRLSDLPPGHTVVWPFGSRLARDKTSLVILNERGEEAARVGELLQLGGGEVPGVPGIDVLAPALGDAARTRCPGPFWIVGAFEGRERLR